MSSSEVDQSIVIGGVEKKTSSFQSYVHVDRHSWRLEMSTSSSAASTPGRWPTKLTNLLDVKRDHLMHVMFLVETWHDSGCVSFRRLRVDGYNVIDRPGPRIHEGMEINHGGVAAVAVPGIRLSPVDLGVKPGTFELLCVRVVSGSSACVVAVVYRPGSEPVTSFFFSNISDVLDRLTTFSDPIYLVGDMNIPLDRLAYAATIEFTELLSAYGLESRVSEATHDRGGILDIVAMRTDLPSSAVSVVDVGLSDHRMLRWSASLEHPRPVYTTTTSRPWRKLDTTVFQDAVSSSLLCQPDTWSSLSEDDLARLYDSELTAILDRLIPARTVTCRRRTSDPWFDDDCRAAKRSVRLFERRSRHAASNDATEASAAWRQQRRVYRDLLKSKRQSFWQSKFVAESSSPRKLWRSIDELMGRGRVPLSAAVGAEEIHRFFDEKVAGVRSSTADAPPPSFSVAPLDCVFHNFRLLTTDDIVNAVRLLPDKQCMSDPLPTYLLKENVDVLAPFLTELFNRSLERGVVPTTFKAAYITPLLKKSDLKPDDVKSYRPISNLSVMSKCWSVSLLDS